MKARARALPPDSLAQHPTRSILGAPFTCPDRGRLSPLLPPLPPPPGLVVFMQKGWGIEMQDAERVAREDGVALEGRWLGWGQPEPGGSGGKPGHQGPQNRPLPNLLSNAGSHSPPRLDRCNLGRRASRTARPGRHCPLVARVCHYHLQAHDGPASLSTRDRSGTAQSSLSRGGWWFNSRAIS